LGCFLKTHTRNRAGTVTLRSGNPYEMPNINFNFYSEGSEDDLQASLEGLQLARELMKNVNASEVHPGANVTEDNDLKNFVQQNAW